MDFDRTLFLSGTHHDLTDADCPLLYQCRWADPDKQRFELRCRNEGVIKVRCKKGIEKRSRSQA